MSDNTGQSSSVPMWKPDKYTEGTHSQHARTAQEVLRQEGGKSHKALQGCPSTFT